MREPKRKRLYRTGDTQEDQKELEREYKTSNIIVQSVGSTRLLARAETVDWENLLLSGPGVRLNGAALIEHAVY